MYRRVLKEFMVDGFTAKPGDIIRGSTELYLFYIQDGQIEMAKGSFFLSQVDNGEWERILDSGEYTELICI